MPSEHPRAFLFKTYFMSLLFNSLYNRQYFIVFQPYRWLGYRKRRFLVSANTLHNYIGSYNANTALLKASRLKWDKLRLKFRKHGIIDIYLK